MCGFLFWGQLAARLARRGIAPMTVLIFASAFYMAVQLLLVAGAADLALLIWIGWGFFGTSGSLAFAILSQEFPINMTGRATTALNLLVFLTALARGLCHCIRRIPCSTVWRVYVDAESPSPLAW
jgi:hypothetical protein